MKRRLVVSFLVVLCFCLSFISIVKACSCTKATDVPAAYSGYYWACSSDVQCNINVDGVVDASGGCSSGTKCLVSQEYVQTHGQCAGSQPNTKCVSDGTYNIVSKSSLGCKSTWFGWRCHDVTESTQAYTNKSTDAC